MIDLITRVKDAELMDKPDVNYEDCARNVREISLLNKLTFAYRPTLQALKHFWHRNHADSSRPFEILDIGCGYGDYLRVIHDWARDNGIMVNLTGVDRNPQAIRLAREITPDDMKIDYITSDVFDLKLDDKYHVIINSLFTHHLTDEEICDIMKWMTHNASYGWFINDLHRHWLHYYLAHCVIKGLGFGRVSKNDGPLSVARAFKRRDWERYLKVSGIDRQNIVIKWFLNFRYGVLYNA